MLKTLRKKGLAKKVIWVIAIVIIFSFGFFGTAYLITGQTGNSYAGKIYGKKVSVEDFNKVYQNARIQAIRQYGYDLSKVAQMLNLEAQTWDLILLLRESRKRHIKITDKDVVNNIENDESFQKNGQFDLLLYNAILRSLQIRARDYEEIVRDNLRIAELYKQITSSVTISEEEVRQEYKDQNEKVQVSYVLIPSADFIDQAVPEEPDVEQYFQEHSEDFKVPPSVNVQYLSFDFPKTESTDAESGEDPDAVDKLEAQKDAIREKAEAVFQQLLVNPDMEQVARKQNLQVKTSGFFSKEQPNLSLGWSYDLLNRIFQMQVQEVNEPFETTDGMAIVQVKEKRDSYIPAYEDVQEKTRQAVRDKMAKDIARDKSQEQLALIKGQLDGTKVPDFPKTAQDLGLEIHQTPVFGRGQYLPQIGISKDFQEAAFALSDDNKLSETVEIANGFCILYLDNYTPIDDQAFEKDKDELAETISQNKQNSAFSDFLVQIRNDSGLVDNLPFLRAGAR